MKKFGILLVCFLLCAGLISCAQTPAGTAVRTWENAHTLVLSGDTATLDGEALAVYDYTWHCDPTTAHTEVENAPAEYYTGTKPETGAAAYIDSELYYFPSLPESGFQKIQYDGETEWAYYYTDGENEDFIFATLPALTGELPIRMMHTAEEAAKNKVLHITKAGTYVLTGIWNGQIKIDLGEDARSDPQAKVTVILNGADITCTVAPGLVFENAYECDYAWEEREMNLADVDTTDAGVTVLLADGTENTISGENVFRMLKTKYKSEDDTAAVKQQKKMRKLDGALYSYVTMNIDGEKAGTGKLTVHSGFEGIDSELHLSFRGGNIMVDSQDDGINVNEDHVSVVKFDGANVEIHAANGAEGDGVDSNGYIVINSGTVSVSGVRVPDSALDSEDGVYYNGGKVLIDGTEQPLTPGTVKQEISVGKENFPGRPDEAFDLAAFKEKVAALPDDATLADVLALLGRGGEPFGEPDGDFHGQTPPERPDGDIPDGQNPPAKP